MRALAQRVNAEKKGLWFNLGFRSVFLKLQDERTAELGGTQALICSYRDDVVQLGQAVHPFVSAIREIYADAGAGELGRIYDGGQELVAIPDEYQWIAAGILDGHIPPNLVNDPMIQRALRARAAILGKNAQVEWAWEDRPNQPIPLGYFFSPTALFGPGNHWDGNSDLVAHGSGKVISAADILFGKETFEEGGTHKGIHGPLRTREQKLAALRALKASRKPYQFQQAAKVAVPTTWSPHFFAMPGAPASELYLGTSRLLVNVETNGHVGNYVDLGGPQDHLGRLMLPIGQQLADDGMLFGYGLDVIADPADIALLDEHCTVEVIEDPDDNVLYLVIRTASGRIIAVVVIEINDRWNGGTAVCHGTRRLGHTKGYSRFAKIPGNPERVVRDLQSAGLAPRGYGQPGTVPVVIGEQTLNGSISLLTVGYELDEAQVVWENAVRECGGTFVEAA